MLIQMPAWRPYRTKASFLLLLAGALLLAFSGLGAGDPLTGRQLAPGDRVIILKLPPLSPAPAALMLLGPPAQGNEYDVGAYNAKDPGRLPEDYKAFLKRNPQVEKVTWLWEQSLPVKLIQVIVVLKSGNQEIYTCNRESDMARAERKYGKLPWPAPPVARYDVPPPVPARPENPIKQE